MAKCLYEPIGALPPLPNFPARTVAPPERRQSGTFDVDSDSTTPTRSIASTEFAALASVFDGLSSWERIDFVELGFLFHDLDPSLRRRIIELASGANWRGP